MPYATVNGEPVARGELTVPRTGCAIADLRFARTVDDPLAFAQGDHVTLTFTEADTNAATDYRMAVRLVGREQGMWRAELIGGAGHLTRLIPPKFYRQAPGDLILADALRAAGEAMAIGVTITAPLPVYVRRAVPCKADIQALVSRYRGATWRVRPDGTVWAGEETWPDAPARAVILEASPSRDRLLCHPMPALAPGVTLYDQGGARLGHVERLVQIVGDALRTEVWISSNGGGNGA